MFQERGSWCRSMGAVESDGGHFAWLCCGVYFWSLLRGCLLRIVCSEGGAGACRLGGAVACRVGGASACMLGGWGWCVTVMCSVKDDVLEMNSLYDEEMENEAELQWLLGVEEELLEAGRIVDAVE